MVSHQAISQLQEDRHKETFFVLKRMLSLIIIFHKFFKRPKNKHLYVDDSGSIYIPNIYCNYQKQLTDVEKRMNKDLEELDNYTKQWHQPVNAKKDSICNIHTYCETS